MGELLRVTDLKKYFPIKKPSYKRGPTQYVRAVNGVDFTINAGETFGLVGESGCGKTTVGKLVIRLHEATGGEIEFMGQDILALDKNNMRRMRREMQIVFQDPYGSLNPRMTIRDVIAEPIKKHRLAADRELNSRVAALLSRVGLSERDMKKYPHEFSGGQRQRICIARALAVEPKLIVCDEPVSALDVSVQSQILNLLKELQQDLGIAYLFIAHGMPVVRYMSHRVGVMYLGRLVEVAECEELFTAQLHPYSRALMSAIPVADPDHRSSRVILKGDVPSPTEELAGCGFASRCPATTSRCRTEIPRLGEVRPGHFVACHLAGE